jgi:hypothetical protein
VVCGRPGSPTSGDGRWSPSGPMHAPGAVVGGSGPCTHRARWSLACRVPSRARQPPPGSGMPPRPGSAGVPFSGPGAPRPSARRAPRLGSARATAFRLGAGAPTGRVAHHRNWGIRLSTAHHRMWGTPAVHRARWVHGARRVTVPGGCMGPSVTTVPGARMGPKQRPGRRTRWLEAPMSRRARWRAEAGLEQGERLTAMERLRQRRKSLVVLPWVVRRWA